MAQFKNNLILILFLIILGGTIAWQLHECECPPVGRVDTKSAIKIIDTHIHKYEYTADSALKVADKKKKSVNRRKPLPPIRETFDSAATKDTLQEELTKAVQVIKQKDSTIADQDTIIKAQEVALGAKSKEVEAEKEKNELITADHNQTKEELKQAKKAVRKEKRKAFFRGVVAGAVTVGIVIVSLVIAF